MSHRAVVHVDLILDAVGRDGRRLLLRGAETVSRLWERAHNCRSMVGGRKAFTHHVCSVVRAGTRLSLLTLKLLIEVAEFLSHRIVHGASSSSKAVFLAIPVRARKVIVLLLENLVDVQLLHRGARDTEGVRERSSLRLLVDSWLRVDLSNATLVLLKLLVAKAVLSFSETNTCALLRAEVLFDLVAKGISVWFGRGEARSLTKGKLLLRGRIIANGSFTNDVCHLSTTI